MKIISVNVGLPRELTWDGRVITTGIFKQPVSGRVTVRKLNLDGDQQADLSVHGGPHKAVYLYPAEHYDYWHEELPRMDLTWGSFGENLTAEGFSEDRINIGDRLRVGASLLMVTQPRMPCYKLAAKFNRKDMVKRFLESCRTGFYLSVLEEGDVGAGDTIELVSRDRNNLTVADVTRLYVDKQRDPEEVRRAVAVEALPDSWRDYFLRGLEGEV